MAKSKSKDKDDLALEGLAQITLSKAHFFLEQANRYQRIRFDFECYVEAAILFARNTLDHLYNEYHEKLKSGEFDKFKERFTKLSEENPLIKELIDSRNIISHQRTMGIVPSKKDVWFLYNSIDEATQEIKDIYRKLPEQLDAVEAIIDECEKQFK